MLVSGRIHNMVFECSVCGHHYLPDEGDQVGGVPGGTDFEDLPDEWVCPVCGMPKSQFAPGDARRRSRVTSPIHQLKFKLSRFRSY